LEKIQGTILTTDWNEGKAKPASKEAEEESDDSDFDEAKALEEQKRTSTEMWDDEENVIEQVEEAADEEGEDEISLDQDDLAEAVADDEPAEDKIDV
jgi:hypothetical protein